MDIRLSLAVSVGLIVRPRPLIRPDFRLSMEDGVSDLGVLGFAAALEAVDCCCSGRDSSGKVLCRGNNWEDFALDKDAVVGFMACDFGRSRAGCRGLRALRTPFDREGVRETVKCGAGEAVDDCSARLACSMLPSTPGPTDFLGWRVAAEAAD